MGVQEMEKRYKRTTKKMNQLFFQISLALCLFFQFNHTDMVVSSQRSHVLTCWMNVVAFGNACSLCVAKLARLICNYFFWMFGFLLAGHKDTRSHYGVLRGDVGVLHQSNK